MKAVVMVGGKGTRLRPLTCNIPKPMVPVANKPMMEHVVSLLKSHGVDDLLVTLCYLPEAIENYFGDGSQFGVSMRYFREDKPLGTAGSVKSVEDNLNDTFVVTAGDVLTDIDLSAAIARHRETGAMATLVLTRVDNPLEYGVVITEPNGRVRRFLEKPSWGEVFSDTVNTCIYILEPECLRLFERDQPFDFSKDLFPILLRNGDPLYGYIGNGYWSDIGNLDQYRQSHHDILRGDVSLNISGTRIAEGIWVGEGCDIHPDAAIEGPAILGDGCCVGPEATVGEFSVLGDGVIVGPGASIKRSVVWSSSHVGGYAQLRGAVVCGRCTVRRGAAAYEGAVLGAGSSLGEDSMVRPGVKIWPGKSVDAGASVNESLIWGARSSKRLFGSNGVSGIVNVDITPEFAAKLAAAYGSEMVKGSKVAVSNDPNKASRMLKRSLVAGLMSAGVDVVDLGTLTTSVARYAIRALEARGGIHARLSARNSDTVLLEFLDHNGLNLDKGTERKIENAFFGEDFARATVDRLGEPAFLPRLVDDYLKGLLAGLNVEAIRKSSPKLVVYYEPGCLSLLLPSLLDNLGCTVTALDDQEGMSPDEKAARIGELVISEGADLGVAVDGNADGLALVDEHGHLLDETEFFSLLSLVRLRNSPDHTIAVPVTAPMAVDELARRYSGTVIRTKNSLRSVMEQTVNADGSDGPAHPNPVVDSLASLARILEFLAEESAALSEAVSELPVSHVSRRSVPCPWESKGLVMRSLIEETGRVDRYELIDGVKVFFDNSWALVLPDPDRPVCHILSEGMTDEEAEELSLSYADKICQIQGPSLAECPASV